ncbi:hypothetical protein INS49_012574 [Diaporthe citri]|uniref:uncharacterized protein n=1 Tax=Diaporthe citri TaxID=83186 RepID=UPI001C802EB8|nr:uncharacterized protein INS49_012574 [Diaporthe citri]KAG6359054.1 hypothetical protein INS49_012574 [Diaporthe citri]
MAEAAIGRRMLGEIEETSLDEVWRFHFVQLSYCLGLGNQRVRWALRGSHEESTMQVLIADKRWRPQCRPSASDTPTAQPNHPSITQTPGHEIADPQGTQILSIFRTSLNSTSLDQGDSSPTARIPAARGSLVGPPGPSSSKVKSYPIQDLDRLVVQHFRATQSGPLSLSGRHLPLIYLLVATLIAAPHNKAVVIIDIDAKFDITRVTQCAPHQAVPVPAGTDAAEDNGHTTGQQENANQAFQSGTDAQPATPPTRQVTAEDLKHVHVYRPARGSTSHIREVLSAAEHHMIYSRHASIAREWWGSIIIGGGSPAVLGPEVASVTTGWRGWLRVDREEVRGFGLGMSIEEALLDRERRQRAVNDAGWTANCVWGGFTFDG